MLNVSDEAMKDSKNEENQTVIRWVISKRLKLMALPPRDLFTGALTYTPGQLISDRDSNGVLNSGTYRIFQVGMVVNGAKYWYDAMELCRSSCFSVDFVIPSLDADVGNLLEEREIQSNNQRTATTNLETATSSAKAQSCELTYSSGADEGVTKTAATWSRPARTVRVGTWLFGAKMDIGKTFVTFRCNASCRMTVAYGADASTAKGWGGFKTTCDHQSSDGTEYYNAGRSSIKAWARSQCVYFTEGSFTLDLNVTGTNESFSGSANYDSTADLGTKGTAINGATYGNTCAYFNR